MRPVDREKFFASVVNLDKWQVIADLRKLKKSVRRESSKLSGTATVNAFNYFDLNFIRESNKKTNFYPDCKLTNDLFNKQQNYLLESFSLPFSLSEDLPQSILERLVRLLAMKLSTDLTTKENSMTVWET